MQDYIQQSSGEVAIVIYDAPLPPKYFRVTKRLIKTLFVVFPVTIAIILFLVFTWGLGARFKATPKPVMPQVITDTSSDDLANLEVEIKTLQESNKQLSDKLASTPSTTTTDDPYLSVIKKPYGMQNLTTQKRVNLDQIQFTQDGTSVGLKFQIISANPETKVMGHILVLMISEAGIMAYPQAANASLAQGIKYSEGEPFSVSRLRPTNAQFTAKSIGENAKFMIYIFNREGDLLVIKETENFKVKTK